MEPLGKGPGLGHNKILIEKHKTVWPESDDYPAPKNIDKESVDRLYEAERAYVKKKVRYCGTVAFKFIYSSKKATYILIRRLPKEDFRSDQSASTSSSINENVLWWKGDSRGVFKVGAAYRIPYKAPCLTCLLAKEVTLTQDNVIKRGMWGKLRNCKPSISILQIYSTVMEGVHAKDRARWRSIPASIWWAIWKERNSRCFESIENIVHKVKLNCILLLCFWCNQLYSNDVSIIDV
ncbi:hypothetical protein H5410_006183 [Solanum commersonii]|uniref:Reverse transcriptase zinc-binding domain-containing protein n=1 Tax=Solanum commersonii TaxID=4109 RepID=A0A9J6A8N0_SOLCO|nr:hypothetical protein H5410_006183 [Solanum commersonii]